jgi:hypothetical protein
LDAAFRGQPWEALFHKVSSIGVAPPGVGPNPIRNSLWIGVNGGDDGYFLVNKLGRVVQQLSALTGQPISQERTPSVAPTFRPAWSRWSPLPVLLATGYFLYIAISKQNVIADVFVAGGVLLLTTFLVRLCKSRFGHDLEDKR